jgi:hypothetical protein
VLADDFVCRDEPGKAIGLGVGDDKPVEGIAVLLLVEGGSGDSRKVKIEETATEYKLRSSLRPQALAVIPFDYGVPEQGRTFSGAARNQKYV